MKLHVEPSDHRVGFVALTVRSKYGVECEQLIPAHTSRQICHDIRSHGDRMVEHYGVTQVIASDDLPIAEATAAGKIVVPAREVPAVIGGLKVGDDGVVKFIARPVIDTTHVGKDPGHGPHIGSTDEAPLPFGKSMESAQTHGHDSMRREHRKLTDGEQAKIDSIKAAAESIDRILCPHEGPRFNIARERLEEAIMWATKAITA